MDPIEKAEHTMFFNGIYLSCSLKLGSHLEFSIPVLGSFKEDDSEDDDDAAVAACPVACP